MWPWQSNELKISQTDITGNFVQMIYLTIRIQVNKLIMYIVYWWTDPPVLSGPAGPYWHKSGLNCVLYPTVSGRFSKRPSYVQSSHRCSHLSIALKLSGLSEMGSFLIIVVNLYSYKDSDVGNLRTIKYFRNYCWLFRNTWNTI